MGLGRSLRRLFMLVLCACTLAGLYACVTVWRASTGLPQWDGRLDTAGLDHRVDIVRDEHGVPHILATTEPDLYFAQGFVHAQDRFWQMALARRLSAGRLSEWLGRIAVTSDRRFRAEWVEETVERSWTELPEQERQMLEAYAAGVNAWLEGPLFRRPPEMVVLHISPERWRPQDAILALYQLQSTLSFGGHESRRAALLGQAADPSVADILEPHDRAAPPIIPPLEGVPVDQRTAAFKDRSFSNSWVLSGAHTTSGYPLLANDPQLGAVLPNHWQLQSHSLDGRTVVGGSIPGIPGIVVGHNGAVAWGMTTAGIDVIDTALLEQDPANAGRFRRGPGHPWVDAQTKVERIRVRFARDVIDTVRATPGGVILPDALTGSTAFDGVVEERRGMGRDLASTSAAALLRLNRAASVSEAYDAIALHIGPLMNFTLADTSGTIGYVTGGRIPSRPTTHATTVGLGPADDNARTYLPYSENPRLVDPAGGRIVSANQRIVGDEYPHYLTDSWAPPDRALRIHELLDQREQHDVASFVAMQVDDLSPVARRLIPLLLEVEPLRAEDARLVELLGEWDYRFVPGSSAPAVFLVWLEMLNRRLIDDELGENNTRFRAILFTPVDQALSGERPDWCDDIDTQDAETCPQLLAASLTDAREALEAAFGVDPAGWGWERVGAIRLAHLGFGPLPVLGNMFSKTASVPGGPESMFNNMPDLRTAPRFFRSAFTSTMQAVYDLSDLNASEFMAYGGTSGHFRSPYYNNLTDGWVAGERFRIPTRAEDIESAAHLSLLPVPADERRR